MCGLSPLLLLPLLLFTLLLLLLLLESVLSQKHPHLPGYPVHIPVVSAAAHAAADAVATATTASIATTAVAVPHSGPSRFWRGIC